MTRERVAHAALAFAMVSPVAYMAQRMVERWVFGDVDPTLVIRQVHTAFYWRCATSAWWGTVAALLVLHGLRTPRPTWVGSAMWGVVLVVAAWLVP